MRERSAGHMKNVDWKGSRGSFGPVPQTALLVNFVAQGSKPQNQIFGHAKSLEKMEFFVRRHTPDSLRRVGAVSAILSEDSIAAAFAAASQNLSAQCRLPPRRPAFGT